MSTTVRWHASVVGHSSEGRYRTRPPPPMFVADQRRAKSICEQEKTVNIAGREKPIYLLLVFQIIWAAKTSKDTQYKKF